MSNEQQQKPQREPATTTTTTQQEKQETQEKQCRICFDGDDADSSLGRLFKPCLCTGTISYVHVKCLQTWRLSSHSNNAFWRCPQCHFHYRFARTKAFGLGTNPGRSYVFKCFRVADPRPVVVGILSTFFFILLVMLSSYVTSYFLTSIEEQSLFGTSYFFVSPLDVAQDLVRAAIRILRDQDILPPELEVLQLLKAPIPTHSPEPPSLLNRFIRRFLLGLPMIGVGSLFHMLLALPIMGPLQWIARWRGNRCRRGNNRDLAAAVIVIFIVIGAARTLYKVYGYTRKWAERFLTWAEDSILEVN
ncbi:hypothetical protein PAXINDRAFT_64451 [Paxillus involutus ATCC 200175]|nr:hypothetical protein PAXINDRAFT_64451 [Paxillus involutus ATCC 200175]